MKTVLDTQEIVHLKEYQSYIRLKGLEEYGPKCLPLILFGWKNYR